MDQTDSKFISWLQHLSNRSLKRRLSSNSDSQSKSASVTRRGYLHWSPTKLERLDKLVTSSTHRKAVARGSRSGTLTTDWEGVAKTLSEELKQEVSPGCCRSR
eukprot:SAG31_NODE_28322_length_411_cov_4.778846_1_plen_102_part_01